MKFKVFLVLALILSVLAVQLGFAGGPQEAVEPKGSTAPAAAVQSTKLYDTTEFYSTLADYTAATGKTITKFAQSPLFDAAVVGGKLPPVGQRISEEPMVMIPLNEVGKYGGRLRTAAMSPVTGSAETWTMRTQPILIYSSDLGKVVPNIAKGYALNTDFTVFTLYLRKGMKWSDGVPFTADDFVFWFEAINNNAELVPNKIALWKPLTNVQKISDYEVRFTFSQPQPTVVDNLANFNRNYDLIPFAPAHYLKQFHSKYNNNAAANAKAAGYATWSDYFLYVYPSEVQARMRTDMPALDPWILTTVDKVGNKYFERNPYYWKIDTAGNQLPYIDGQDRLYLDSPETVQLKAIAGDLDVLLQFSQSGSYATYVQNETKGGYSTLMWQVASGQVMSDIALNLNHPDPLKRALFNDLRFREAISLAINRQEINQAVWRGLGVVRQSTVGPTVSVYDDWMGDYMINYDLAGANSRLDAMGLKWDADHKFRLLSNGQTATINLEYVLLEANITALVELLKTYWEAAGIKTTLKLVEQSLYFQRIDAGENDLSIWNRDESTELGNHAAPFTSGPNARIWYEWIYSKGAKGEQPPADVVKFYQLCDQFVTYALGTPAYLKTGTEILTLAVKNLWHVGIAGLSPKPVLIKKALGNTPKRGVIDYDYRFWMIFHPEQFYWKQ